MSAVRRVRALLRADVSFQLRHGFYVAYAFVCAIYVALLYALPPDARMTVLAMLVFIDTSILGFALVGGIVLLERSQGVHRWLFVSPARLSELLVSKLVSITALSLAATGLLYAGVWQMPEPLSVAAACVINAALFTLMGILLSFRVTSINGFFLSSVPIALPFFVVPLLAYFEIVPRSPALSVIPTSGTLSLLTGTPLWSGQSTALTIAVAAVWCTALWGASVKVVRRYASRGGTVR